MIAFKRKYGDCLVPVGYEENPQLANWVSTQRQEYKQYKSKHPSRLTQEKMALLKEIGFVWEAQRGGAGNGGGSKRRKRTYSSCAKSNDSEECSAGTMSMKSTSENFKTSHPTKSALSSIKQEDHHRPWIAMFKDYLWYLDQNRSPEEIPSLKQWADLQREEYVKQRRKHGSRAFQEVDLSTQLTLDQFKLLQSINFDWRFDMNDSDKDIVEKCPSAESESTAMEGNDSQGRSSTDSRNDVKNDSFDGIQKSTDEHKINPLSRKNETVQSCIIHSPAQDMEVAVAQALFSMGATIKK